jgi:uncharacterized protein YbjT (DUF2867 family)
MSHIKRGASIVVPDSLSVDTASAAAVQHFVYISVTGTLPTWGIFLETRRAVEEYVKQSGMIYTILRPNYLMDLWLGPGVDFDIANARVQIFGSGEGKINWVALGDVLQFAVQALDHPAAHNATLELNGPNWLSQTNCCVKRSSPKMGFLAECRYTTFGMVSK